MLIEAGRCSRMGVERIEKPWGFEDVLFRGSRLVVLRMVVRRGEETSLHRHLEREEAFVVVDGDGWLERGGRRVRLKPGDVIFIGCGEVHRWIAGDRDLVVVEVTTPPLGDVERLEDRYGRV